MKTIKIFLLNIFLIQFSYAGAVGQVLISKHEDHRQAIQKTQGLIDSFFSSAGFTEVYELVEGEENLHIESLDQEQTLIVLRPKDLERNPYDVEMKFTHINIEDQTMNIAIQLNDRGFKIRDSLYLNFNRGPENLNLSIQEFFESLFRKAERMTDHIDSSNVDFLTNVKKVAIGATLLGIAATLANALISNSSSSGHVRLYLLVGTVALTAVSFAFAAGSWTSIKDQRRHYHRSRRIRVIQ